MIKDSGEKKVFSSGMQRDSNILKPRFDLLLPEGLPIDATMLGRWTKQVGEGASKYGERNWEKAFTNEEYRRFKESAFRHLIAWMAEENDEDHAAALFFNVNGAEYIKFKNEKKQL